MCISGIDVQVGKAEEEGREAGSGSPLKAMRTANSDHRRGCPKQNPKKSITSASAAPGT